MEMKFIMKYEISKQKIWKYLRYDDYWLCWQGLNEEINECNGC